MVFLEGFRKPGSWALDFVVGAGAPLGGRFTLEPPPSVPEGVGAGLAVGGDTDAIGRGGTGALSTALGVAEGIGGATAGAVALGSGTETTGRTPALPVATTAGASCSASTPLFEPITTTARIASATPTTDPATSSNVRRRFCCCSAAAWLVLNRSPPLCWINDDVAETDESPGAENTGGAGGAGGGASGAVPAAELLIFIISSGDMRIVPPLATDGSGAHGEVGSSFAVVGAGAVQLAPLPNAGSCCNGNVVLKLGGAGGGIC